MRVSDYFVQVPLEGSTYLLFHLYTGAIDIVNQETVGFLEKLGHGGNSIDGQQLALLKQRGYLTERTPDQERSFVVRLADFLHKKRLEQHRYDFFFVPTYNCNFRCPYCYEKVLRKHGKNWLEKVVDRETVDQMFEVIVSLDAQQKH